MTVRRLQSQQSSHWVLQKRNETERMCLAAAVALEAGITEIEDFVEGEDLGMIVIVIGTGVAVLCVHRYVAEAEVAAV